MGIQRRRKANGFGKRTGGDTGNVADTSFPDVGESEIVDGVPDSDDSSAASGAEGVFDPGTIGGDSSGAGSDSGSGPSGGKRRGRKPGTRNKRSRADSETSADSIKQLLVTTHYMLASLAKTPELMLTEDEAGGLATAMQRVSDLYEISILPEKTVAWLNLAIIAGGIYGPRFAAVSLRRKTEAQARRRPPVVINAVPDIL